MSFLKSSLVLLLPLFVSFLMHWHVLAYDVVGYHVWRQSQTQTVIYNFCFEDDHIFNPQRFEMGGGGTRLVYEFPMYQWLIAKVDQALGYSVSNSRTITFFLFSLGYLFFFLIVRSFLSFQLAYGGAVAYCFSPVLYYYCFNPLPDIFALTLAHALLYLFLRFFRTRRMLYFLLYCVFLSLAILAKLPYLMFAGCFIVFIELERGAVARLLKGGLVFLSCLALPAIWYFKAASTWNTNPVLFGLLRNDKSFSQMIDYMSFHLYSSLPELLIGYASFPFFIAGLISLFRNRSWKRQTVRIFLYPFIAGLLFLLYELNMIERTHDYYFLPLLPFLFLVVALGLQRVFLRFGWRVWILLVAAPVLAFLRIDHRWDTDEPGFRPEYLQQQAWLQKEIPEDSIVIVDSDESHYIALYYLKRKGFSMHPGELNCTTLQQAFSKGARYLVSENAGLEESNCELSVKRIASRGLTIYKLER